LYINYCNVNRVPYRFISTSALQGTVYISFLIYGVQYAVVSNNFIFRSLRDYFMYVPPDDDPIWIETCWSLIL